MRVFQLQREPGTRHYLIYVPGLNARKNVVAGVQKKRKHQLVIGCWICGKSLCNIRRRTDFKESSGQLSGLSGLNPGPAQEIEE